MKRYHFKTGDQSDVKGIELVSLAAVKCEAAKIAAGLACAAADDAWHRSGWMVTVSDDHGQPVLQLKIEGTQFLERKTKGAAHRYRAMREVIERVTQQSGRLYELGQEAHYQALAAGMALRAAGYSIQKTEPSG